MIAAAILSVLVLTALPPLLRLFAGPTHYDRLLSANALFSRSALACAAAGVVIGAAPALDAALALLVGAFIANVAALKFFGARNFQPPLAPAREEK